MMEITLNGREERNTVWQNVVLSSEPLEVEYSRPQANLGEDPPRWHHGQGEKFQGHCGEDGLIGR